MRCLKPITGTKLLHLCSLKVLITSLSKPTSTSTSAFLDMFNFGMQENIPCLCAFNYPLFSISEELPNKGANWHPLHLSGLSSLA